MLLRLRKLARATLQTDHIICVCLRSSSNKNILCEQCVLVRDPVDSVNLAIIVLQFGSALISCGRSSRDYYS